VEQAVDDVRDVRREIVHIGNSGPASWLVRDSFRAYTDWRGEWSLHQIGANERLARAFGDEDSAWRCREIMVSALAAYGRLDEALAVADDLAMYYLETDQSASRLQILGQTIAIRFSRGEVERGLDELAQGLAALARLGETTRAAASAFLTIANAASTADMFEMAASQLRRATDIMRRVGVPVLARLIDGSTARNDLRLAGRLEVIGRYDEANARYREVLRSSIRTQQRDATVHGRRVGRLYEGYAWASLGEPELGRVALLEALGRDNEPLNPEDTVLLRLGLARACAALGLVDEGRLHLQQAANVGDPTFSRQWQVAIVLQAAEVERVDHGDHSGIELAKQAAMLLANSLWQERERRLEAVMMRMQMLDLAEENERVEQAATEDPLTGLGNRRRLDLTLLDMAADGTETGCLLFIDLDRFKDVNDTFSHAIGDEVLKTVAALLRTESRDTDVLARYGGDEFVVVLRNTSLKEAMRAGERIRAAVAEYPWSRLARGLSAHVSVGVAEHRPGMTYDEVMCAADAALYSAKQLGRDRVAVA
jgi:diguanylate cyclase